MINSLKNDLTCCPPKYPWKIGLNRPLHQIWSSDAGPGDGCDPDGSKAGIGGVEVDIRQQERESDRSKVRDLLDRYSDLAADLAV